MSEPTGQQCEPAADKLVGSLIDGKYRVIRLLGSGGVGAVYLANHEHLDKPVAIKILHETAAHPEGLRRFYREARMLERLSHPNVLKFLAFGQTDSSTPFAVTEYVPGITLADLLKENNALTISECSAIFMQVLDGLAHAHEQGIVHRDLKPSNILLAGDPSKPEELTAKIADFGLAKLFIDEEDTQKVTKTGVLVGTPLYMSPEQCAGRGATAASDIYSIGCILFQCMTGKVPFESDNSFETMMQHTSQPAPPVVQPGTTELFSTAIESFVHKAMEKDPGARYRSAVEMRTALMELTGTPVTTGRRKKIKFITAPGKKSSLSLLIVAVVVATSVAVTMFNTRSSQSLQYIAAETESEINQARELYAKQQIAATRAHLEKAFALARSHPGMGLEANFVRPAVDFGQFVKQFNARPEKADHMSEQDKELISTAFWYLDNFTRLDSSDGRVRATQVDAAGNLAFAAGLKQVYYGNELLFGNHARSVDMVKRVLPMAIKHRLVGAPNYFTLAISAMGRSQELLRDSVRAKSPEEAHKILAQADELAELCEQALRQLRSEQPSSRNYKHWCDMNVQRSFILEKLGRFKECADHLGEACRNQSAPEWASLKLQQVVKLVYAGDHKAAQSASEELLKRALQTGSPADLFMANYALGWSEYSQQHTDKSKGYFRKAIELGTPLEINRQAIDDSYFFITEISRAQSRWNEAKRAAMDGKKAALVAFSKTGDADFTTRARRFDRELEAVAKRDTKALQ